MLGFVNINRTKEPKEYDSRKIQKRKKLIFDVVYAVIGLGLLNIILYLLTRV